MLFFSWLTQKDRLAKAHHSNKVGFFAAVGSAAAPEDATQWQILDNFVPKKQSQKQLQITKAFLTLV